MLYEACLDGHLDLVQHLILIGPEIPTLDCLDAAIRRNHVEMAQWLLKTRSGLAVPRVLQGSLVIAMYLNYHDMIAMLESNFGVRSLDTHLTEACKMGYYSLVKYLIQHGHKPTSEHLVGACGSGSKATVEFLVQESKLDPTPGLSEACTTNQLAIYRWLLSRTQPTPDQLKAHLDIALKQGHYAMTQYLVNHLKISISDQSLGLFLRWYAVRSYSGHRRILRFLIRQGKVQPDPRFTIPACDNADFKLLRLCWSSGVAFTPEDLQDVSRGRCSDTPKVRIRRYRICRYMIEKGGVEPTAEFSQEVCEAGNLKIARYLLRRGLTPPLATLDHFCQDKLDFRFMAMIRFLVLEAGLGPTIEQISSARNFGSAEVADFLQLHV